MPTYGPTVGRIREIGFYLVVAPKENEEVKNVTLYVPFPREDSNLMPGLLKAVKEDYANSVRISGQQNVPDVRISSVKTKHGTMLKLVIPRLWNEVVLDADYRWASVPIGRPDQEYPLKPLNKNDYTYVYSTKDGSGGLYLKLSYGADYKDYFPILAFHEVGAGGTIWRLAGPAKWSAEHKSYLNDQVAIEETGWTEVPVYVQDIYRR